MKDQATGPMDHDPRSGPNYNEDVKEEVRRPQEHLSKYEKSYNSSMKDQATGPTDHGPRSGPNYNEGVKEQVRRPQEYPSKYEKSYNSSMKDQATGPMDHGPRTSPNYNEGVKEQVRRPSDRPSKYQQAFNTSMKDQVTRSTDRNPRYGPSYNEGTKEQLRQPQERASKYETAYNSSMKEQSRRPMDHNPKYDPKYYQGAKDQLRRPMVQVSKYNTREAATSSGWRPSSAKSLPLLKKSEYFRAPPERAYRPTLGMDDSFSSSLANTWWDRRGKPSFLGEDCELPIDLESPQENFFWVPLGRYSWEMRNIKVWKSQVIDQKESLGSKEYMGIFPEIKLQKPQMKMSDTDLSLLSRKLHSTHSSTTSCCKICNICLLDTCYCQCR
jgi:hypothetical protein